MKKLVLLGAGYGTLSLLKALPHLKDTEITLINQNPYHYYSVLLHEVAAGEKKEACIVDLNNIIGDGVNFICDRVVEIKDSTVICEKLQVGYDILVIGLGFGSDNFGIKGIVEHTLPLTNYNEALFINSHIKESLAKYQKTKDKDYLRFVICGGGFSGSELAGSLTHTLPEYAREYGINKEDIEIYIIEALPNILPMFPPKLIAQGQEYLKNNGVILLESHKILSCEEGKIILSVHKDGTDSTIELTSKTIIWTAGVKGNPVIDCSKLFTPNRSKIVINSNLQPISVNATSGNEEIAKNIYVVGDSGVLLGDNGRPLFAPTAQLAEQQGIYLARLIAERINNDNVIKDGFVYQSKGTICSLGNAFALFLSGETTFSGYLALVIKRLVEYKWRVRLFGLVGAIFKS